MDDDFVSAIAIWAKIIFGKLCVGCHETKNDNNSFNLNFSDTWFLKLLEINYKITIYYLFIVEIESYDIKSTFAMSRILVLL